MIMSFRNRLGAVLVAALLAVIWTLVSRRAALSASPPAPTAPVAAPSEPAAPDVKARKRPRRKSVAKKKDEKIEQVASIKTTRGERLREKGEALGGDATQRQMTRDEKAAEKADQ